MSCAFARSLEELQQWPAHIAATLWTGDAAALLRKDRIIELMRSGPLHVLSDFSGTGAAEFGLQCVWAAAAAKGIALPDPVLEHACDCDPECQKVLLQQKAKHVFQNVFDRLPGHAKAAMDTLKYEATQQRASPSEKRKAVFSWMDTYLHKRRKLVFNSRFAGSDGCLRHPYQR